MSLHIRYKHAFISASPLAYAEHGESHRSLALPLPDHHRPLLQLQLLRDQAQRALIHGGLPQSGAAGPVSGVSVKADCRAPKAPEKVIAQSAGGV